MEKLRLIKPVISMMIISLAFSAAFSQTPGERMAAEYFRIQTARVAERALADVKTLDDWKKKRELYSGQFLDMLGLSPLPPKTDLKATITGKLETEKFTLEKLYFQSMPGLYVTANLYIPKNLNGPAPAILYVCGHLRTFKDGVAYGTKVGYQHHPAWFAEHGYVALIIDTLEMGEIEGDHHGTYRHGQWWWPTRGYTPAGVETWNSIRALDYLATRPEVDMKRIGVTGRSGGGAYTWFLAAVDERPSVLIPVAGITDMTNHVVDGCIENHCDCMYQVNTYGWDFSMLAALAAPRPLLLSNSDKDRIFPLEGVQRIHKEVRRIYGLYGAEDKLGLLITEGPHSDTQDLQTPAFRWMNRWLKNDQGLIAEPAIKRFEVERLRVFSSPPADQINTRIHEIFVPAAPTPSVPQSKGDWSETSAKWMNTLRERVFNNWPDSAAARRPAKIISDRVHDGLRVQIIEYRPDDAYSLQMVLLTGAGKVPASATALVLDQAQWLRWREVGRRYFPSLISSGSGETEDKSDLLKPVRDGRAIALILPRGVGPSAWPIDKTVHIRRRFLLLGQSLEAMQVWDARAAVSALRANPVVQNTPISLRGSEAMSVVAMFAALFEPAVSRLELDRPPATLARGPSYPNALRYFDMPQLLAMVLPRAIVVSGSEPAVWGWTAGTAKLLDARILFENSPAQ